VSDAGRGRYKSRSAAAAIVVLVLVLAGCGKPANLDTQEQVAFARECTSLIERGLSNDPPPRAAALAGEQISLDSPSAFYSVLERLRGPATYNLHDPRHASDTARQPLDDCSTKAPTLSSLFGRTTTTSTSTTSTTTSTTATTATTRPGS
jgi:hypothetical protein